MENNDYNRSIAHRLELNNRRLMKLQELQAYKGGAKFGAGLSGAGMSLENGYELGRSVGLDYGKMSGGSFWSDFADGFMSVVKPVAGVVKHVVPGPARAVMEMAGLGNSGAGLSGAGVVGAGMVGAGMVGAGMVGAGSTGGKKKGGRKPRAKKEKAEKVKPGEDTKNGLSLVVVEEAVPKIGEGVTGGAKKYKKKKVLTPAPSVPVPVAPVAPPSLEGGTELGLTNKKGAGKLLGTKKGGRKLLDVADLQASTVTGAGKRGKSARAEIVKKVMKEKGMKLAEASKYVKENKLY